MQLNQITLDISLPYFGILCKKFKNNGELDDVNNLTLDIVMSRPDGSSCMVEGRSLVYKGVRERDKSTLLSQSVRGEHRAKLGGLSMPTDFFAEWECTFSKPRKVSKISKAAVYDRAGAEWCRMPSLYIEKGIPACKVWAEDILMVIDMIQIIFSVEGTNLKKPKNLYAMESILCDADDTRTVPELMYESNEEPLLPLREQESTLAETSIYENLIMSDNGLISNVGILSDSILAFGKRVFSSV